MIDYTININLTHIILVLGAYLLPIISLSMKFATYHEQLMGKAGFLKVFDFEAIPLKKSVDIFESMDISLFFYCSMSEGRRAC